MQIILSLTLALPMLAYSLWYVVTNQERVGQDVDI